MDSILTAIKKLLGIEAEYTHFDPDIIIYINSVFATLKQLGVGPATGFSIADATTTWADYLGVGVNSADVQSYIYLKVRLIFDPPSSSVLVDAIKSQIAETEWRIQVEYDPIVTTV